MWRTLPFVFLISSPVYAVPVFLTSLSVVPLQELKPQQILQRLYEQQTIILGTHIQLQDQVSATMDRLYQHQTQLLMKL